MNKKISLKFKLLLYYLLLQVLLFFVFAGVMYHLLHSSIIDKLETNLKIILLDLKDDVLGHHKYIDQIFLDKEIAEFQMKPLYIKVKDKNITIQTKQFPQTIVMRDIQEHDKIYFDSNNDLAWASLHFMHHDESYKIIVATQIKSIADIFPNILYIILVVVPIVLLLAIILGNVLISRSFAPIEKLLFDIDSIGIKDLSRRVETSKNGDEIDKIASEINKLLERVDKSYSQISQFTSDASHELKTPLTIIQGELEVVLKEERDISEYKKSILSVLDEVKNIKKIIESLIILAKVDSKLLLDDDVYLDEIVFEVIKDVEYLRNSKNILIQTNIYDPVTIKGNEELLKIVLKNLVENGIFYSSNDEKIIIELKALDDDGFELKVMDNGIGMDEETQENIFEKFYRSDASRSKHTGGFGLGMSIVKKICEVHKIDINVKSSLGVGSTFILSQKNKN